MRFIAYKRTKQSAWQFSENSVSALKAIEMIAPEGGNYQMVILVSIDECKSMIDALNNMSGMLIDNKHCEVCVEMALEAIDSLKEFKAKLLTSM